MKKWPGILFILMLFSTTGISFAEDSLPCWFPPGWAGKQVQAEAITDALARNSGLDIRPRIAGSYPEILTAFSTEEPSLVYVGSFVQAIIAARKLGTPLSQNNNGKAMYSGVMVFPEGQDPLAILKNNPTEIAFAIGASSGESSAKAATKGLASLAVANHGKAVAAVVTGQAKAAFVKDWWWLGNSSNFPGMTSLEIPGVSVRRNPDNVLTASRAVPKELIDKLKSAALASSAAFGSDAVMVPFEGSKLAFSLGLMQQGGINPLTYSW